MPSRVIRDGWLESVPVSLLKAEEERFFLRLCLRADDHGRYHANPTLLRSNLFPLREDVRSTDIPRWLAACEKAGLLRCYEVTGTGYLEIAKFGQRMRSPKSKYPPPTDGDPPRSAAHGGYPPPESESEADLDLESDLESEKAPAGVELVPLPDVLMTAAFEAKWAEYIAYRKAGRMRTLQPVSVAKQWAEMAKWGHDVAIEAIDTAIRNSWTGVFEPKVGGSRDKTRAAFA